MEVRYIDGPINELIWCNTHQRRATKICVKISDGYEKHEACCDPKLGGILVPCQTIDLTGKATLESKLES